ncbi:MAG TPA: hypothetical protein VG407_07145 [Caulobacteraceae bacterium]|nr:hypothetical protein [Caulobacteraceae bacterium]
MVAPVSAAQQASCLRALRPIAAASIPAASDFEAVECRGAKTSPALRYDRRAGAARAVRTISVGEIVPGLPAFAVPAIRPGQTIYLNVEVGAVRVQRAVQAVQASSAGPRIFVRTTDTGEVFAVPLASPEARP